MLQHDEKISEKLLYSSIIKKIILILSHLQVSVTLPITSAPLPAIVPAAAPEPSASLTQSSVTPSAAVLEQSRDTDSPGTICPFPSITEFIEDPCAKLGTPEPILTPPKAPTFDLLNLQDTNHLGPPPTLSLESEVDEEIQSTRLVSIEEFLRQDQEPYARTQQVSYHWFFIR